MKNKSKGKMLNMKTRSAITGYAYIAPWIAGFLLFTLYPLIFSVRLSLNEIKLDPAGMEMLWRGNYYYNTAWNVDTTFRMDLGNTVTMILFSTPVILIFSLIIAIVSGALLGHTLFEKFKEEEQTVFNDMSPIYFLREGVYDNLEYALASANKFDTKIIVKEKAKYYLYLAISKSEDNLASIKKIYNDKNLVVETKNINNESFLTALEQMENLFKKASSDEEKLTIEKVILANYEELVLKN